MNKTKLTEFQQGVIRITDKGAGLDASLGAMTAKERQECDELVAAGLLCKGKNHSQDKHGMYIKVEPASGVTEGHHQTLPPSDAGYTTEPGGVVQPPTKAQALEALDSLDDFARMTVGVDAKGPRETLRRFIEAAPPEALLRQAVRLLARYRNETPLGHQPHMIAEDADATLASLRKALGEQP